MTRRPNHRSSPPRPPSFLTRLLLVAAIALAGLTQCAPPPRLDSQAISVAGATVEADAAGGGRLASPPAFSAAATRLMLQEVVPPPRSEADLVRRFRHACGTPVAQPLPLYRDEPIGASATFWVQDLNNRQYFQAQATLQHASEHLLFYVQEGVQIGREALAASASVFEQRTYPLIQQYFGEPPETPRITVFVGRVPGVGGYFNSSDALPRVVNPFSNERLMVYMNAGSLRPGTASFDATLAHEVQHFVHWLIHPQQDSWINEGASELAMALAGYDQSMYARSYLNNPETQLTAWAENPGETIPHYGAGYLFLEYFAQRMGGYEHVKPLIATPGIGTRTFDNYLEAHGTLHFDELFRDFVLANLLNDRSLGDGRYGHNRITHRARIQETLSVYPASSAANVRPYATRYIEFQPGDRRGDLELRFAGAADAPLYGDSSKSGQAQWWGNAADEMESSITRAFDLTGVEQATLRFSAWFSIERDYDYAGVAVSTDDGCSWTALAGSHTTDRDPFGQNPGHGFTGRSGGGDAPAWIEETMDLTPYAGQHIHLRFFYITDQSFHLSGIAVDDIAIPEIGFFDDAEGDAGWDARGFIRSANAAAVDWAVQVVAFTDGGPELMVVPVTVRPGGRVEGTLLVRRFGERVSRAVVAVSPLVPVTLEPVAYTLEAIVR